MQAGDSVPIPDLMGRFVAHFRPGQATTDLVLVTALWDQRDFPFSAVLAGYEAFLSAVRDAIADNLPALAAADQQHADKKPIIEIIKAVANKNVEDAIKAHLSAIDALEIHFGLETADRLIDTQFLELGIEEKNSSNPFTLAFGADTDHQYRLDGEVVVTADPCESELIRIRAAQQAIANTRGALKQLGEGHQTEEDELDAELEHQKALLADAEANLVRCRLLNGAKSTFSGAVSQ
jgi:hypothetical protein